MLKILWVLDDEARFDADGDLFTTEALMKGFCTQKDFDQEVTTLRRLFMQDGRVMARCRKLGEEMFDGHPIEFIAAHAAFLETFDVAFIRVDPPGTEVFRHGLILLGMVEQSGAVLFINSPLTMCAKGSKLFNYLFADHMVSSVVVGHEDEAESVMSSAPERWWVAKPLDRASGMDVVRLHVAQKDTRVMLRKMFQRYGYVLLQHYLPEVERSGEVRHLVFAGEIIAAWRKRPAEGEFRSNLDQGATLEVVEGPPYMAEAEAVVCRMSHIAPGIRFYSADYIGSWLNELNIENIGGLTNADVLYRKSHSQLIADRLRVMVNQQRGMWV